MLSINLLELTNSKTSSFEFTTTKDKDIEVNILKILPNKDSVIIQSNKEINSKILTGSLFFNNAIHTIIFDKTKALSAQGQYVFKARNLQTPDVTNDVLAPCNNIYLVAEVLSLTAKNVVTATKKPVIKNKCVAIGKNFVIIYTHSDASLFNLNDCLSSDINIEIHANDNKLIIEIESVKKISQNNIKITTKTDIDIAELNN